MVLVVLGGGAGPDPVSVMGNSTGWFLGVLGGVLAFGLHSR